MKKRYKLLYIVPPSKQFAGIERVIHDLANELVDHYSDEFDVMVVAASRYDYGSDRPRYLLKLAPAEKLRQLSKSLKAVLKEGYDLIICPQVEASTVAWIASPRLCKGRLLVHLHGNPSVERLKSLRARLLFAFFDFFVSKRVAGFLCVSESLTNITKTSAWSRRPIFYSPNPVRQFDSDTFRIPSDADYRYVTLGRLTTQKGHDLTIKAFAKVCLVKPNSHLDIIGDGPDRESLQALVLSLGISEKVNFHGHMPDPSVVMIEANCFVLSSRWEGFGNAVVEALSLGLPAVVTDCKYGPSDIVNDQEIGLVAKAESVDDIVKNLLKIQNTKNSQEATEKRIARARDFSFSIVGVRHAEILRDILSVNAPKSENCNDD